MKIQIIIYMMNKNKIAIFYKKMTKFNKKIIMIKTLMNLQNQ